MPVELALLLPLFLIGALLYTSVGHGGATVYLAILTLAGYTLPEVRTTVLALNIVAAGIAFVMFQQAGHLRWKLLLPFAITSVPFAYLGGHVSFESQIQSIILGLALLLAAARLILLPGPPRWNFPASGRAFYVVAPILGAILGFLAGVTGIGGGIFLSPLLLFLGWADVRQSASVASAFIVLNSLAGLAARLPAEPIDPSFALPLAVTVLFGAVVGSLLGARSLPPRALQTLLGMVLVIAATKALAG